MFSTPTKRSPDCGDSSSSWYIACARSGSSPSARNAAGASPSRPPRPRAEDATPARATACLGSPRSAPAGACRRRRRSTGRAPPVPQLARSWVCHRLAPARSRSPERALGVTRRARTSPAVIRRNATSNGFRLSYGDVQRFVSARHSSSAHPRTGTATTEEERCARGSPCYSLPAERCSCS